MSREAPYNVLIAGGGSGAGEVWQYTDADQQMARGPCRMPGTILAALLLGLA